MTESSNDVLQILSRLAMEYQQKQNELESFLLDIEPQSVAEHLVVRMEMTTNHFRLAQKDILSAIVSEDSGFPKDKLCHTAMTLCRCFDEMRILFSALAHKA